MERDRVAATDVERPTLKSAARRNRLRPRLVAGSLAAALVVILAGCGSDNSDADTKPEKQEQSESPKADAQETSQSPAASTEPAKAVDFGFDFPGEATDSAPLVEVFVDFLCPHCGNFEEQAGEFLSDAAAKGDIRLRFMPMTIMDGNSETGPAHDTMNAAVCAAELSTPEQFKSVHDDLFAAKIYENQDAASPDNLIDIVEKAGISDAEECVRTTRFGSWLDEAREAGSDRGVRATPTVLVNGEPVEDITPNGLAKAFTPAIA